MLIACAVLFLFFGKSCAIHDVLVAKEALLAIDNVKQLLALGRVRQILIAVLGNQDVIFNTDAADVVVALQHILVDMLGVLGPGEEVTLDVLSAEIAA